MTDNRKHPKPPETLAESIRRDRPTPELKRRPKRNPDPRFGRLGIRRGLRLGNHRRA